MFPALHRPSETCRTGAARPYTELSLYNAELLKFCVEAKAVCIDLAGEIRYGPGDFYDSLHTTRQGTRKIGLYLAEKLAPLIR